MDSVVPFDPNQIPSGLKDLFAHVIKDNNIGFERISHFRVCPAISAEKIGATTSVHRVIITAELIDKPNDNFSYVLKDNSDSGQMKHVMKTVKHFIPEKDMYSYAIPELEQMYKSAGVDNSFAPKAHDSFEHGEHDFVLLQDLQPLGYKNFNRTECLDMMHAKCVLKKLSKFHAATATRVASKGPFDTTLMNSVFADITELSSALESTISPLKTAFLRNLKHYNDAEKYESYLVKCLDRIIVDLQALLACNENEFNVLNHGDCVSKNLLFKYNENGNVDDVLFVDFDTTNYGSPAQDLYFFIFSSLHIDIKLKEFDYLIRFYYDNLIANLKLLKYKRKFPVLQEIFIQLFKYGKWPLWATMTSLPFILTDAMKTENMSTHVADMSFENALFSNKHYQEHINEILPWLFNRGLLEPYDFVDEPSNNSNEMTKELEATKVSTSTKQKLQAPNWITDALFEHVLKHHFEDFKSIKKFNVGSGTNEGDNYLSTLLKIDVEMELDKDILQNTSFIMKIPLNSGENNSFFENLSVFHKELSLYNDFIPKFEKLYKNAGVDIVFGPKCFHVDSKTEKFVVLLENLRPLGYQNCNRLNGLDENHTKAVLRKVAEFHAASAVFALENEYPPLLQKGMYVEEKREIFENIGRAFFPIFVECVKEFDGHEEFFHKVVGSGQRSFDDIVKATDTSHNYLNVLNHGDLWTNNVLFKHDENRKIENTCLIDYQMVQYGSPAIDLYYFLLSSPALDIKLKRFDHFVEYYYDHLVENLKFLKYPKYIPTLKELHQEMLEKGAFAFSAVSGILAAVLLDPTEQATMENMLSQESVGLVLKRQMYSNPRYRKHAEAIFTWLSRRGLLNGE